MGQSDPKFYHFNLTLYYKTLAEPVDVVNGYSSTSYPGFLGLGWISIIFGFSNPSILNPHECRELSLETYAYFERINLKSFYKLRQCHPVTSIPRKKTIEIKRTLSTK